MQTGFPGAKVGSRHSPTLQGLFGGTTI
jgi:hypothetical protein